MFNLETAVQTWRASLRHQRRLTREDLDELESHLRDYIEAAVAQGAGEEEAFRRGMQRLGDRTEMAAEYGKNYWVRAKQQRRVRDALAAEADMLRNYAKIAFRNLWRHRGYAAINITGLAIGFACCVLLLLFVRDELQYDRFHAYADRLYRVTTSTSESGEPTNANGSFPLAPNLQRDFPEVEKAVRFRTMGEEEVLVQQGDQQFYEPRFVFADAAVFEVFSFPLRAGDPSTALTRPQTVALSASMARKYFGDAPALGQTLHADPYSDGTLVPLEVTAVFADLPTQSHLQFDFLVSFETQTDQSGWGSFRRVYTYLLLAAGAEPGPLEAKLPAFLERHVDAGYRWYALAGLQPLTEIHLHSRLRSELRATSDIAYVYLFSGLAVFLLLIAGINFVNLTTARATMRAKEVGLRKVVGAYRRQLVGQFLGEAVLLSLLGALLAVGLMGVALPYLNGLAEKAFAWPVLAEGFVVGSLLAAALGIGVLAGSYPAFVLARFQPVAVLKGRSPGTGRGRFLRRGLVAFQFMAAVGLMASAVIGYQQSDFIRTTEVGFAREQVMAVPLNGAVKAQYEAFMAAVREVPRVEAAATTSHVPAKGASMYLLEVEGSQGDQGLHTYFVGDDFAEAMGLRLVAGRLFGAGLQTDAATGLVVNERAVAQFGWGTPAAALGKTIQGLGGTRQVIGVVEDFHVFSLHRAVQPLALFAAPPARHQYLVLRLDTANLPATLAALATTWGQFQQTYPFSYFFVDDAFAQMHRADLRLTQVLQVFTVLALFLSCLGLFGLVAFTAAQRTKKMGIRRVLGASSSRLLWLLAREVLALVGLATLLGLPLAYLAMQRWLGGFAYRTEVSPALLLGVAAVMGLLALLTISYQTLRTARTNPAQSLRYE